MIDAYLAAASAAHDVLSDARVAARWDEPSALPELRVGALAGHVSRAVLAVAEYLEQPAPPAADRASPSVYFATVLTTDELDSDLHRGIRARSEAAAEGGPAAVLQRFDDCVRALRERLPAEDVARPIQVFGGVVMTVEDYLATRIVELVVHTDDLAVSVGLDPPEPAGRLEAVVLGILVELAAIRHGPLAVIRALARRERAGSVSITAF